MYYFTTYQTQFKKEFWFTITERMTGKIKFTSATHTTIAETEETARECVEYYEAIARRDEQDYINSLNGESST